MEGWDDNFLWRSARMAIPEGFQGKKIDMTKKIIPRFILKKASGYDAALRLYISRKSRMAYHLRKRPIIMIYPQVRVIWHGENGQYPDFFPVVED